jgi:hypothetical protein
MVKQVVKPHLFSKVDWLLLGLFIGLATLSKVHGLFLWIGFGAYLIFNQTKLLREPYLYFAIATTIICVSPILYWNFQNDFITYRFHSQRVMHTGIHLDDFLQQIIGEFLYQNPIVYLSVLIPILKRKKLALQFQTTTVLRLLLWLSLPLIFTFWILSLFNPTLPHWTGPGFIGLFLIAGVYWATYSFKPIPSIIKGAIVFVVVLIGGFISLVYIFPSQLGATDKQNLGEYNPINDVTGWETCKVQFEQLVIKDIKDSTMQAGAPIVTHKWFPGGHILFYIATPLNMPVIGVGKLVDLHKFVWLNKDMPSLKMGENAYTIVPSNLPVDPQALYGAYFEKIELAKEIPIETKGVVLRNFYFYRLLHCKKTTLNKE